MHAHSSHYKWLLAWKICQVAHYLWFRYVKAVAVHCMTVIREENGIVMWSWNPVWIYVHSLWTLLPAISKQPRLIELSSLGRQPFYGIDKSQFTQSKFIFNLILTTPVTGVRLHQLLRFHWTKLVVGKRKTCYMGNSWSSLLTQTSIQV